MVTNNSDTKRILIVHNKYNNVGGEDIAVSNVRVLKKKYNVETLFFDNKILKVLFSI